MTSVVAVSLALASPYCFRLLRCFLGWLLFKLGLRRAAPGGADAPVDDKVPLLHVQEQDALLDVLDQSESSCDFAWRCVKYVKRSGTTDGSKLGIIVLILVLVFTLFLAWTTIGIVSANIASDKVELSSSTSCGLWQYDDKAGDELGYRDDLYNHRKESSASQYARNCYNTPNADDTMSCGIFFNQSIGYQTKSNQRCPFSSSEMCYRGLNSAVTFDTGLVDASIIGINDATTHKFCRSTSCSPLNMSDPYVSKGASAESSYRYNYGPKEGAEFTYNTSGHPFDWLVPFYGVE